MGQSQKSQGKSSKGSKGSKGSKSNGIQKGNKSNSFSNVFIFLAIFSTIVSIFVFIKNMMSGSS
jgi:hypothetical protein